MRTGSDQRQRRRRLVPPPVVRSRLPTEVEEEVLIPLVGPSLNGATVDTGSVGWQTLRSGKKQSNLNVKISNLQKNIVEQS